MQRRRRLRVNWTLASLSGLVGLAVIILAVWKLPSWLYGDVTQASPDARLQAANGFRTALIAGLAGAAAVGSLTIAARNYRLTERGQLTDRYSKAVEQLGSDKQDVRLGGIYALERIAIDSPSDRATIEEVLTAFVRGHSPLAGPGEPSRDDLDRPLRSWSPDVQAALTVLGRRKPPTSKPQALDFSETDLLGANLNQADLRGANFWRARLQRADLVDAQLQHAHLRDAVLQHAGLLKAQLEKADLADAQLQDAMLRVAQLHGASLIRAQLQRADLMGAQLEGAALWDAQLQDANLQRADLRNARLHRADLTGAQLQGADLTGAQLAGAKCSTDTAWPDGFDWRAAGVILREH